MSLLQTSVHVWMTDVLLPMNRVVLESISDAIVSWNELQDI
jgi:hypothetical protein